MKYIEKCLPTAEQAIEGMKKAKELNITKNGYYYNFAAKKYMERLAGYYIYVHEDEQNGWANEIRGVVNLVGEEDEDMLLEVLHYYEIAAVIMKELVLQEDNFKNKIKRYYMNNVKVAYLVIRFSKYGCKFADEFVDKYDLKTIDPIREAYERAKEREASM